MNFKVVNDESVSDVEVRLDKINVPDKIQLHQQTSDVLYSGLLQSTLNITKLQSVIEKLENQLTKEKVENKENLFQIKTLQIVIVSGTDPNNIQLAKKLLGGNENTIQTIKKKLKV